MRKNSIILLMHSLNSFWNNLPLDLRAWITRNYISGIKIILVLVLAKIITSYSGKLIHQVLKHAVRPDAYPNKNDREKRLNTLVGLSLAAIKFAVWLLTAIVIIGIIGVNTTPLFASAGLIGAGLAFGAQSLIKDLLSGLFIIYENQYRVGDYVELLNVSGTVQSIGIRTTVLRDLDGSVHYVPNGSVVVATNKTMGFGQLNLDIIVADKTDMSLLEHLINHAGQRIAAKASLKDEIIDPPHFARIVDYSGNGITVKIIGKTTGGAQLEVKSAFLSELKKDFDQNKIKLGTNWSSLGALTKTKK